MMQSKEEFAKGFQEVLSGKISTKDFARMAMEYFESPDYNRWKAAQAAEDFRRWREGRAHLMDLIEKERQTGTSVEYEIRPLKDGFDSLCITINGKPSCCFPSFFGKEFVNLNWQDVMETKKQRACGYSDCYTSTSIDDVTLTFGRMGPDEHGFFDIPCAICAEAYQKVHPDQPVWPMKNAPQQG